MTTVVIADRPRTTLAVHPAAALFPMMSPSELADLAEDIEANGQNHPIVVWTPSRPEYDPNRGPESWEDKEARLRRDGQVLDGRNRLRACELAGVEPSFEEYDSTLVRHGADPYSYVLSQNVHRRHLEPGQRATIAAKLATLAKGTNQHTAQAAPSQAKAAELLNVSVDSVQRARKVLENGAPELVAAVERGTIHVKTAAAVAQLPIAEQQEALAQGRVNEVAMAVLSGKGRASTATATVETPAAAPEPPTTQGRGVRIIEIEFDTLVTLQLHISKLEKFCSKSTAALAEVREAKKNGTRPSWEAVRLAKKLPAPLVDAVAAVIEAAKAVRS